MKKIIINTSFTVCLLALAACGGGSGGADTALEPAGGLAAALPALPPEFLASENQLDLHQAHRFLTQASYGPSQRSLAELMQLGRPDWIEQQFALPATYMRPQLDQHPQRWAEYVNVWWRTALQADDQLRQRMAFALSQIFVISGKDKLGDEQQAVANYYDILVQHAFGNFRDLMEAVTLSPVMGEYLSMKGNRKPDIENNIRPDENYARELLQLFTIGLVQLNLDGSVQLDSNGLPAPTYDQDTVEAFAHVFTGWHFANVDDFRWPRTRDYITPMQAYEDYHDTGSKTLLNGTVLPAGQSANADLEAALDNIFEHPNVGPFIGRQLIQRFVTSNPTPAYIADIAAVFNNNGAGERGDLGSVIRAILLHPEAVLGHESNPETFGKLKEPALRVTALWRAFTPESVHPTFNYAYAHRELQQAPLNARSVFNFFTPHYSQPGQIRDRGLVSPEFEIHDETSIITITNRLLANSLWSHNFKYDANEHRILINIDREVALVEDPEALLDHLDDLLLGGRMSTALRNEARLLMDSRDYDWSASQKVVEAIFLIVSAPEAAVQI